VWLILLPVVWRALTVRSFFAAVYLLPCLCVAGHKYNGCAGYVVCALVVLHHYLSVFGVCD